MPMDTNEYGEKLYPCPITGGLYESNSPKNTAIEEAKEEAGYDIKNNIEYLGRYFVGTQTSEIVYMFFADVTGQIPEKPKGDGTYFESISKNEWRDFLDLKEFDYSACKIGFSLLLDVIS
jgi:8-oxo-dGTP pyrophosphatase MutT (NUDIX family)